MPDDPDFPTIDDDDTGLLAAGILKRTKITGNKHDIH